MMLQTTDIIIAGDCRAPVCCECDRIADKKEGMKYTRWVIKFRSAISGGIWLGSL
jgi:hypothetical protein